MTSKRIFIFFILVGVIGCKKNRAATKYTCTDILQIKLDSLTKYITLDSNGLYNLETQLIELPADFENKVWETEYDKFIAQDSIEGKYFTFTFGFLSMKKLDCSSHFTKEFIKKAWLHPHQETDWTLLYYFNAYKDYPNCKEKVINGIKNKYGNCPFIAFKYDLNGQFKDIEISFLRPTLDN